MANTQSTPDRRLARRPNSMRGTPWISTSRLDAYLQARDALRRARATAALADSLPSRTGPPAP